MKSNERTAKVVLMALAFVGLGMTLGFASFYIMFLTRCGGLVQEMEDRHNSAVEKWQLQYREVAVKHERCVAESENSTELEEIKGRLEAQTILKRQHDEVKTELSKVRNQDSMASQTIQQLQEKISIIEKELTQVRDENEILKNEHRNQLEQIAEQAKSLQDLQFKEKNSAQKVSELSSINSDLEKRLEVAFVNLDPCQKKIEEQAQALDNLREKASFFETQESASSQTIEKLKYDLKQETLELIKCKEHLQAISIRDNVQHRREKSAKDASASLPCMDEHEDCGLWANRGECASNPTYMNRFCRKTCKVCPQNDDIETKWIDNEAAPTLDEKFA